MNNNLFLYPNYEGFVNDVRSRRELFSSYSEEDLKRYFADIKTQVELNSVDGLTAISYDLLGLLIISGGCPR